MKNKETSQEKCEFIIYPSNFDVKIKELKPFHVHACSCLLLNLQISNNCNINTNMKIKSKPKYGNLYLFDGAIIIYKPIISFSAFDTFQILIEDEYGETHIESVLIYVCK